MNIQCLAVKNISFVAADDTPGAKLLGSFEITLLLVDVGLVVEGVQLRDKPDGDSRMSLPGAGVLKFSTAEATQEFFTAVLESVNKYRDHLNREAHKLDTELRAAISGSMLAASNPISSAVN